MGMYENGPSKLSTPKSRVLQKFRDGKVASCIKVNTSCPRTVEMFASSGIDSIWLCTEHTPTNQVDLENQVRAARIYGTDTIIRVRRGSYSDYIVGYEMGGTGLMVPHIMSFEDAKKVVDITKFPPMGKRVVDGGNVDGIFCRLGMEDYLKQSNEERFVIYQIEDREVVPDLERIVELPGVDMVLFGAGDYSVSIGKPGQMWTDPEVCKLREHIAKVARKAGKAAGLISGADKLKEAVDMGYNFYCVGSDVAALNGYSDMVMNEFAKL